MIGYNESQVLLDEKSRGRDAVIPRWDRSGFARYGHMSTLWSSGDDMKKPFANYFGQ
jgi:hypothetical protein